MFRLYPSSTIRSVEIRFEYRSSSCLPIEVLAVHHEHAFLDERVVLKKGRGLERGQCLAAACCVPDVAVAVVLVDTPLLCSLLLVEPGQVHES